MTYVTASVPLQADLLNFYTQLLLLVFGAIITGVIGYIAYRLRQIDELTVTVFGLKTVEGMRGLVDVVSQHEDDIQVIVTKQEELERAQEIMNERQKNMMEAVEEIESKVNDLQERQRNRINDQRNDENTD